MRKALLTMITLLGLTTAAAADPRVHTTPIPVNVTAVALDSVQNDDNVSSMSVYVSITDMDGAAMSGLQAGDFTTTLLAGESVGGLEREIAPGVYMFSVSVRPDPFGVQGRSAAALIQVHHVVASGVMNANVYQGQAMARADFSRASVTCRR